MNKIKIENWLEKGWDIVICLLLGYIYLWDIYIIGIRLGLI